MFKWETVDWSQHRSKRIVFDMKAAFAELVAMMLFVSVGCGTAAGYGASDGPTRLVVAFAFGMGILVLAYTVAHHSGGHINCAVTWSLVLGGAVPWYQGLLNLVFQLIGSVLGALLVAGLFPCGEDNTTNLGTNIINPQYGLGPAFLAEVLGTFLLCEVVWETAVSPLSKADVNAALAIGFSVFIAHLFMLPIDGCSINPSRSFGPAIVSYFRGCQNYTAGGLKDLWVFWVAPLVGGTIAALLKRVFAPPKYIGSEDSATVLNPQSLE